MEVSRYVSLVQRDRLRLSRANPCGCGAGQDAIVGSPADWLIGCLASRLLPVD